MATKSAGAAAPTAEQRKSTRHKALKGGRIIFNNGWSIACTVRNVSEGGAKLHVENTLDIPSAFRLVLNDGSSPRECVVRWRNAVTLGVEFE